MNIDIVRERLIELESIGGVEIERRRYNGYKHEESLSVHCRLSDRHLAQAQISIVNENGIRFGYFSRLLVPEGYRNEGIGSALLSLITSVCDFPVINTPNYYTIPEDEQGSQEWYNKWFEKHGWIRHMDKSGENTFLF